MELARLADLPEDVIAEAQRVADKLSELEEREHRESHTNKIAVRRKALLRVTFPAGSDISGMNRYSFFCVATRRSSALS